MSEDDAIPCNPESWLYVIAPGMNSAGCAEHLAGSGPDPLTTT